MNAAPQQPAPSATISYPETNGNTLSLPLYTGTLRVFPLMGEQLTVSAGMDTFNYYRKMFKQFAKAQADALAMEYCARVVDLDSFLIEFPEMYERHRKPLINLAMDLFAQAGIYDLSPEQFENQHTADFCLCGEDVDNIIESFNLTIEANQDRKIKMYNMMPGVVFHGIGGFAAALALNVAVNKIAEADIRNANVTAKQRAELFARINYYQLMERAFVDYWRVFLSLTWQMKQRGLDMWYPDAQDNERANGLFANLMSGRIPPHRVPEQLVILLTLNPYADDPLRYIHQAVGVTNESAQIFEYFDYQG